MNTDKIYTEHMDRKEKGQAVIFAYSNGIIIGILGMIGIGINYPLYNKILNKSKEKYSYGIICVLDTMGLLFNN